MIEALIISLVVSLLLTLVLECGFFFIVGKSDKKDLLLLVLVNVLTNPLVVLTFWLIQSYTYWNAYIVLVVLEVLAVVVEGGYYKKFGESFKRPFLFALAANAFSFLSGLLIQQVI